METTIHLDKTLLRKVEQYAKSAERSVSDVIDEAIRKLLQQASTTDTKLVELITFRGDGLQSGVSLDNNATLQALMDANDAVI